MCPELLDDVLRSLDPADSHISVPATPNFALAASKQPGPRRFALAAAAVSVVAVGLVAAPSLLGGGAAFATWRPAAVHLSPTDATAAADRCLDVMGKVGAKSASQLVGASPVIAEARGHWQMVVLSSESGYSGTCIGSEDFGEAFGGSNTPTEVRTPASRGLSPVSLGTGNLSDGDVSVAIGRAGAEVVGVTYDSATRGIVQATVDNGWFALWLPGDDMASQAPDNVPLTLTLRDGTTESIVLGFSQ